MNNGLLYQSELLGASRLPQATSRKGNQLLRLIRAFLPFGRLRLSIDKSTVTENVKPLLASGILREESQAAERQKRRSRVLSFADNKIYFIGVNLGVRHSQVGLTTLRGEITDETEFETPTTASYARSSQSSTARASASGTISIICSPGLITPPTVCTESS